jgi:2-hydroxychromene-2-carboxylate isomerase
VEQPVFYYDLADPECYLVAERVMSELPVVPEWEPVLGEPPSAHGFGHIERRAAELGVQQIRWPSAWPPNSREAMLAATYAKRIGKGVAFSLAAFRQAFAGGRDLGDRDTVLIAGAACEMHPSALLKAIKLRSVGEALEQAGLRARTAGVKTLPAIQVGDEVFDGPELIESAAAVSAA